MGIGDYFRRVREGSCAYMYVCIYVNVHLGY